MQFSRYVAAIAVVVWLILGFGFPSRQQYVRSAQAEHPACRAFFCGAGCALALFAGSFLLHLKFAAIGRFAG